MYEQIYDTAPLTLRVILQGSSHSVLYYAEKEIAKRGSVSPGLPSSLTACLRDRKPQSVE